MKTLKFLAVFLSGFSVFAGPTPSSKNPIPSKAAAACVCAAGAPEEIKKMGRPGTKIRIGFRYSLNINDCLTPQIRAFKTKENKNGKAIQILNHEICYRNNPKKAGGLKPGPSRDLR